jgi:hypothetical protein
VDDSLSLRWREVFAPPRLFIELGRQDGKTLNHLFRIVRRRAVGHGGSTSYETEFKGTPPFTLTSLDGSRAIGSWPGSGSSRVVVSILQLDKPVTNSVVVF